MTSQWSHTNLMEKSQYELTVISNWKVILTSQWPHSDDLTQVSHCDITMISHSSYTVTSQYAHTILTPWHHNLTQSLTVLCSSLVLSLTTLVSCVISNELRSYSNTPAFPDSWRSSLSNLYPLWSRISGFFHVITAPACPHMCYSYVIRWYDMSTLVRGHKVVTVWHLTVWVPVTSMWYHSDGIIVWDICEINVIMS